MKLPEPLDLSKWRDGRKIRNRIHRLGVELEGGWETLPRGTRPIRDGSLDPFAIRLQQAGYTNYIVGEVPSPPLSPRKDDEAVFWEDWLKKHWPVKIGEECGLHLHMSFLHAFTYQRLMNPTYPATIVRYMREWAETQNLPKDHPIWPRLEGKSPYCQHKFFADEQAATPTKDYNRDRQGHRYTVINYCYVRNHTLECRLLPMFDTLAQGQSALAELQNITNLFLVATAAKEPTIEKRFTLGTVTQVTRGRGLVREDAPERLREVRNVIV
jgi:hypothetical protein